MKYLLILFIVTFTLISCNDKNDSKIKAIENEKIVKQYFSTQDKVSNDDNYIRSMRRLHATCGKFHYTPSPNDNVNINVGSLTNLFDATGWHLDLNEDRRWDVHCINNSPNDYIVIRCKPFTSLWETVSSFRVPAHSNDVIIESFQPDNEDQWWVAILVKADGKLEICNGEPGYSDALLAPDSKSALFGWHNPSEFEIRVQAK